MAWLGLDCADLLLLGRDPCTDAPDYVAAVPWPLNACTSFAIFQTAVAAQCTLEALKMVTMCSTGLNNYMM